MASRRRRGLEAERHAGREPRGCVRANIDSDGAAQGTRGCRGEDEYSPHPQRTNAGGVVGEELLALRGRRVNPIRMAIDEEDVKAAAVVREKLHDEDDRRIIELTCGRR